VTFEHVDALALQCVPHVALVVVVATKQITTRDRESNGSDTTTNRVVFVHCHLFISTCVEQAARSVVGTSGEGVAIGEVTENFVIKKLNLRILILELKI
jgi:hypothetical protein